MKIKQLVLGILGGAVAVGALFSSSAQAATVDPATYTVIFSGVPNAVNESGAAPEFASYFAPGVNATAANTTQPAVSAGLGTGCSSGSGCPLASYGAQSQITYHLMVTGPSGVMVPFYFQTAGGITLIGDDATGIAEVTLSGRRNGSPLAGFDVYTLTSVLAGGAETRCGTDGCVNSTKYVSLLSNTQYDVQLSASVRASSNRFTNITAWADPYIYIDPTFSSGNQFSLIISEGVGNSLAPAVPEPSTWAMMILGFFGIGYLTYRRRTQPAALSVA